MLSEAVLTLGLVSVILGTASGARIVGIIGAMIAVGFEYILKGKATKAGAEAAQGILDENAQGL
jgi:hypothetical protein